MVYKCFDKISSADDTLGATIMQTPQLAEELPKPIIRQFEKQKINPSFKDNILIIIVSRQYINYFLISKYNKGIRFLLCAIDIFSKYACVIPLKDKKDIVITNAFQKGF